MARCREHRPIGAAIVGLCAAAAIAIVACAGTATRAGEPLDGHGGPVGDIAISGRFALTASFDYSLIYWLLEPEPMALARLIGHEAGVNAVAFVPGGKRAVSGGDDGLVAVWSLERGTLVARLEGHRGRVVDIAVSPDGRYAASAGWDGTVRLWSLETLAPHAVLKGHTDHVNAVAFPSDGDRLYTAGADGTIRVWRVRDGTALSTVHNHGWGVNALAVLPGDRGLAFAATDGTVAVVDPDTGTLTHELAGAERPVLALAVSPDGTRLAAGGADGSIRVWSLPDWHFVREGWQTGGPVWSLAFADDGESLYHGGMDARTFHWDMTGPEVAGNAAPRDGASVAAADPGERQFARHCAICHTLTPSGGNRAGPTLYRLFGRRAGSLPDYPYSPALDSSDIVWTEETVERLFAEGPHKVVPGSKMPLQRMGDPAARRALVGYLKRMTDGPAGPSRSTSPSLGEPAR